MQGAPTGPQLVRNPATSWCDHRSPTICSVSVLGLALGVSVPGLGLGVSVLGLST